MTRRRFQRDVGAAALDDRHKTRIDEDVITDRNVHHSAMLRHRQTGRERIVFRHGGAVGRQADGMEVGKADGKRNSGEIEETRLPRVGF